jgi:hypothetical protein
MVCRYSCLFVLFFSFVYMSGCNRGLNPDDVKKQIAEDDYFKETIFMNFAYAPGVVSIDQTTLNMEKAGFIKIKYTKCSSSNPNTTCGSLSLTEKGVVASKDWPHDRIDANFFEIPIALRAVVDITKLAKSSRGMTAEFTWNCQFNDLGKEIQPSMPDKCPPLGQVKKASAEFKQYDDVWRLEKIRYK